MSRLLFVTIGFLFIPVAVQAQVVSQEPQTSTAAAVDPNKPDEPDLLLLGASGVDFDKEAESYTHQTDAAIEYRWGTALTSNHLSFLTFEVHPLVGFMTGSRHIYYGYGGFAFDVLMWKHWVITESESIGLFDSGDAKPLGSFLECRSMMETGWRFDDDIRLTAQISHISNGGLTHRNPGEEFFGGFVHIPIWKFLGQ